MDAIDLGRGFSIRFTGWTPDRSIRENQRRYFGVPDHPRIGAIITCRHAIEGAILFDRGPEYEAVFQERPRWTVVSEDPLTLEPSIDCGECGCHGHIREGVWVDV